MAKFINSVVLASFFLLFGQSTLACTCPGLSTEQSFKLSSITILGRIVGIDTISGSTSLLPDKKGEKVGRHKYSVHKKELLRVKMIVEQTFKAPANISDTIYVLTKIESTACGYPFPPFLKQTNLPDNFYRFIVYGDQWIEKQFKKSERETGMLWKLRKRNRSIHFSQAFVGVHSPLMKMKLNDC